MKCVDCLPLLDEYAYGEADDRTAMLLGAHVASCEECSAALEALRLEQQVYARYERQVEVTPALWQAVSARLAREESAAPRPAAAHTPLSRLREWLASALAPFVARPALGSALAVAFVGIVSGALWLSLPAPPEAPQEAAAAGAIVEPTGKGMQNAAGFNARGEQGGERVLFNDKATPPAPIAADARREPREARFVGAALLTPLASDASGLVSIPEEDEGEGEGEGALLAALPEAQDPGDVVTAARQQDPEEKEVARHVEQAQMLLRSFKNAAPAGGGPGDLTYEKLLSQKLLEANAALRVGAEVAGDKETRQVLDAIEPFLLDIKNLRDRPSREEVRSIRERMKKNEIIAALQVY